jgi:hypothetical protein
VDGRVRLLQPRGAEGRRIEPVVLAFEDRAVLRPQQLDRLHGLFEPLQALAAAAEVDAEAAVLAGPAGAERKLEPAAGDVVDGGGDLCEDGGMTVDVAADEHSETDAGRRLGDRGQRGPGVEARVVGRAVATSASLIQSRANRELWSSSRAS